MANFKYFIVASADKVPDIDVNFGNLIYCEELRKIYLDGINGRQCYDGVSILLTDAERETIFEPPEGGFYFVEETKTLWRLYDGEWTSINSSSGGVIFVSELPPVGEPERLYVKETEAYVWLNNEYEPITSENVWREV